jgi:ABC-type uncharacterized transport system permease subunit
MPLDRFLLLLSTLVFLGAVMHAYTALKQGLWQESRWHWVPMLVGLILQSSFLYLRGQVHGRCPLTNLFEILAFVCWSAVLLYFAIGPAYRLSLLGAFTAPVVALMQAMALFALADGPSPKALPNPWLELHAALALISYAAYALACVTGAMYLVQARLLKKHRIQTLFHQLPPIHDLGLAIRRLVTVGLILLTVALLCSLPLDSSHTARSKLVSIWLVWAFYLALSVVMWRHWVSTRHIAWMAVLGFIVPLVSLYLVSGK